MTTHLIALGLGVLLGIRLTRKPTTEQRAVRDVVRMLFDTAIKEAIEVATDSLEQTLSKFLPLPTPFKEEDKADDPDQRSGAAEGGQALP